MRNIILALAILLMPAAAIADHHKDKMAEADANKDGKISKEEFLAEKGEWFGKYDTNKDGQLDKSEMDSMMGDHKKKCDEHHKGGDHKGADHKAH